MGRRISDSSFCQLETPSERLVQKWKVMRIRILVTGGTFDKQYDELTGRLFFRETHVPEMLGRGRSGHRPSMASK